MNHAITITKEMTKVEPTIAGYKRGDVVLMSDLVKAAMIKSDNDAAKAIAITVGGDEEHFIAMMNIKARQIGMNRTHFTNPCGYDGADHYSTPTDLLKMTEYAIKNSTFNTISKLNSHAYYVLNKDKLKLFKAYTHNRLLNRYQYAVGVKTGFTNKAGACLIARAKKELARSGRTIWRNRSNAFFPVNAITLIFGYSVSSFIKSLGTIFFRLLSLELLRSHEPITSHNPIPI